MRGGASKTTPRARRGVDRASAPPPTTTVYAAALPAGGTLRDARAVIAADRDDPDDPLAGVPRAFRFVVGGVRVAKRSEGDRRVCDSLTDGETLVLADADAGEAEAINTTPKDSAGRPATTTAAEKVGDAAAALHDACDSAEAAVGAATSFAEDTGLADLLAAAFGIADSVADAVPGARAVLTLAVGIHERFKAQRELSDNVAAALDFVAEVAKHAAAAAATSSLKQDVAWQPLHDALAALDDHIAQTRARSRASSRLGKFRAWLAAPADQEALDACVSTVRAAMKDLNFGMNV